MNVFLRSVSLSNANFPTLVVEYYVIYKGHVIIISSPGIIPLLSRGVDIFSWPLMSLQSHGAPPLTSSLLSVHIATDPGSRLQKSAPAPGSAAVAPAPSKSQLPHRAGMSQEHVWNFHWSFRKDTHIQTWVHVAFGHQLQNNHVQNSSYQHYLYACM